MSRGVPGRSQGGPRVVPNVEINAFTGHKDAFRGPFATISVFSLFIFSGESGSVFGRAGERLGERLGGPGEARRPGGGRGEPGGG